jgi:hypothetical protein
MCYNLILIIVLCGFWGNALAADVSMAWDAVNGATGYKIYMSTDLRATWDTGLDVGNVTSFVYPNVDETLPADFKISAYNANGESISDWRGAWYDHTKLPVDYPSGLGVQ